MHNYCCPAFWECRRDDGRWHAAPLPLFSAHQTHPFCGKRLPTDVPGMNLSRTLLRFVCPMLLSKDHGVCCTSSPCGFSHCRISGDYIFARARFCFSKTAPLAPASGIGQGSLLAASTETVLVAFIPSCMTNDDWISIRRLSISTGDAAPQHRTDRAARCRRPAGGNQARRNLRNRNCYFGNRRLAGGVHRRSRGSGERAWRTTAKNV